ncbi:Uncharacterised protein [Pantoea agglomerans]|uniref:Uncharacterized protein n=1 Tax=Enterobacter agglomerans TaxID=549 RepID=A0A379AEK3_ENTAG|nr:Uncharacterised protein [Pantoea agglomerans]
MNNTWLDVTTILGWHRSAVGIVRTEVECATYALSMSDKKSMKFCAYNPNDGYYEVNADVVRSTIEKINGHVKKKINNEVIDPVVKTNLKTKIKSNVLKVIQIFPVKAQRKIINYLLPRREAVHTLLTSLRYSKLALKQWIKPAGGFNQPHSHLESSTAEVKFPFQQGDEYISLGLDWDQKDFHYLYLIKKKLNLKVKLFCYDVIPVKLPHLCVGDVAGKFSHYFSNVAWCADEIFCISKCSRDDLEELLIQLGTPIPKLTIVKTGLRTSRS